MGGEKMKEYTYEDVQKHCTVDHALAVFEDKVYDITNFIGEHPGGSFLISQGIGRDITCLFLSHHLTEAPFHRLAKLQVGTLKGETTAQKPMQFFRSLRQKVIDEFKTMKKSPYDRPLAIQIKAVLTIIIHFLLLYYCRILGNIALLFFWTFSVELPGHEMVHTNAHILIFRGRGLARFGQYAIRAYHTLFWQGVHIHSYYGPDWRTTESTHLTHHEFLGNDHLDPEASWRMTWAFFKLTRILDSKKFHSYHRVQGILFQFLLHAIVAPYENIAELCRNMYMVIFNRRIPHPSLPFGGYNKHAKLDERYTTAGPPWQRAVRFVGLILSSIFGASTMGQCSVPLIEICVFGFTEGMLRWWLMVWLANISLWNVLDPQHFGIQTVPDGKQRVITDERYENECWGITQMKHTTTMSSYSFFFGGYQIEHHLFPSVSPHHYYMLQEMIRKHGEEHGVKYLDAYLGENHQLMWKNSKTSEKGNPDTSEPYTWGVRPSWADAKKTK